MNKRFISIGWLFTVLLAGCGDSGFDASIAVRSISVVDQGEGLCGYDDDDECHSVAVELANSGEKAVSTNMFYWRAKAVSGGIFDTPSVDGPDACATGATSTITLNFDVTNGDKLTKLMWKDFEDSMATSIPNY